MISRYPETSRSPKIINIDEYDKIRDSLTDYWIEIDHNIGFYESVKELFMNMPIQRIERVWSCENADYADMVHNSKNVYLSIISVYDCENILYSFATRENTSDVLNSSMIFENSNVIYMSRWVISSSKVFYSQFVLNSYDIWFSSNLNACDNCILCDNLTNSSYYIKNIKYTKEEYEIEKNKILSQKLSFDWMIDVVLARKPITFWCNSADWGFLINSEGVESGYFSYNLKDSRNVCYAWWEYGDDSLYDVFVGWAIQAQHLYGVQWVWNSENVYLSTIINECNNMYYCMFSVWCSFCLWCIWLKNKSYCILNKQYTKEDRYIEVDKIFWQMETDGTLGQFFPATMNPFYFNDTAAYLIDPTFTKEEVIAKWYLWRDEPIKVDIPPGVQTLKTSELDSYQWFDVGGKRTINDEILKKVILDEAWNAYRIIPMELEFLRKHELPLPRKHWLDRMKENFRIS